MNSHLALLFVAAAMLAADDLPRVDLHAHIHDDENHANSLTPKQVSDLSKKLGVRVGVLAEGGCAGEIRDNVTLSEFLKETEGAAVWRGLQVYGFDWRRCLSDENLRKLDYIAADALVFPDANGKHIWLWLPKVRFADAQDFMERYVSFNEKVLSQRIQVWANPTYLPESLKARYDELWTPERMDRLIRAAVKSGVAIELNAHFQIPSQAFIRRAKAAGAKFSIGSNAHVKGIGEVQWCLKTARECGLTAQDIFVPARAF